MGTHYPTMEVPMLKTLIACSSLLLASACANKTRNLPPEYVECDNQVYWTLGHFYLSTKIDRSTSRQLGKMAISADNHSQSFDRNDSTQGNFHLPKYEAQLCRQVYLRIAGDYDKKVQREIYQYFDYEYIYELVKSSKNYQEIDNNMVQLKNFNVRPISFDLNQVISQTSFQGSAWCEQKWSVKPDPENPSYIIFKAPQGKCYFSIFDQEVEIATGQKLIIAVLGYYEKDPQFPENQMRVTIEKFGFKNN